jgi:hypothetical protein
MMSARLALQVIALLAGTGALAGFVTGQFLPRRFVSGAVVTFDQPVSSNRCAEAAAQTLSPEALAPLVLQSAFFKPELDFTPVDEIVSRIRENASIRAVHADARDGFRVEFVDADRYAALDVAHMLIDEMGRNAGSASRITEPITARHTGPSTALCTLSGFGAGLAAGVIALALARRSRHLPIAQ